MQICMIFKIFVSPLDKCISFIKWRPKGWPKGCHIVKVNWKVIPSNFQALFKPWLVSYGDHTQLPYLSGHICFKWTWVFSIPFHCERYTLICMGLPPGALICKEWIRGWRSSDISFIMEFRGFFYELRGYYCTENFTGKFSLILKKFRTNFKVVHSQNPKIFPSFSK